MTLLLVALILYQEERFVILNFACLPVPKADRTAPQARQASVKFPKKLVRGEARRP